MHVGAISTCTTMCFAHICTFVCACLRNSSARMPLARRSQNSKVLWLARNIQSSLHPKCQCLNFYGGGGVTGKSGLPWREKNNIEWAPLWNIYMWGYLRWRIKTTRMIIMIPMENVDCFENIQHVICRGLCLHLLQLNAAHTKDTAGLELIHFGWMYRILIEKRCLRFVEMSGLAPFWHLGRKIVWQKQGMHVRTAILAITPVIAQLSWPLCHQRDPAHASLLDLRCKNTTEPMHFFLYRQNWCYACITTEPTQLRAKEKVPEELCVQLWTPARELGCENRRGNASRGSLEDHVLRWPVDNIWLRASYLDAIRQKIDDILRPNGIQNCKNCRHTDDPACEKA